MKLSQNFTLEELIFSETAARLGIDNSPNREEIEELRLTAFLLEEIRAELDKPVLVSSGLRRLLLNRAKKSKDTSAHVWGGAADFKCPGYGTPLDVAKAIAESGIVFDQLIYEFDSWVHIGRARPGKLPRQQVLTINHNGTFVGLRE